MSRFLFCFLLFLGNSLLRADVPMPHSGHISVGGAPFNNTGYFKFAIIDGKTGQSVWNHDGSTNVPPSGNLPLAVVNGFYSIHLGDDSISGMSPLAAENLRELEKASLRVWFCDQPNGVFKQVGVDIALGAAPFALVSELSRGSPEIEDRILAIENTMQALDFEDRILAIENTLQEIPARNIDPVLLAEMGYRKFATRELSGFSLPGLDLTGANFSQAIIRDANLTSAKMESLDIQGGQVVDSNFSNSDLRYANFTGSSISNSILNEVTASGISLSRSVVKNVNFISADLSLADLSDASFEDSNFSSASLLGASFLETAFDNCAFRNASLVNVDTLNAKFTGCDLTNATLSGIFMGADFQNAVLTGSDFSGADLTGVTLKGATGFDPSNYSNVIYFETILPDGTTRTD